MSLGFPDKSKDMEVNLNYTPAQIMAALDQALAAWRSAQPNPLASNTVEYTCGDQYFQVQSLADGVGGVRKYRIIYGSYNSADNTYSITHSFQWSHIPDPRGPSYSTITNTGAKKREINAILNMITSFFGH